MSDSLVHWLGLGIIVLAALAIAWWPAAAAVKAVLNKAKLTQDEALEKRGLGIWIGRFERSLIVLLLIAGAPTAVGLVVAAKSILRFPEMGSKDSDVNPEYVLVGSLASWAIGVAIGYVAIQLIGQLPPA